MSLFVVSEVPKFKFESSFSRRPEENVLGTLPDTCDNDVSGTRLYLYVLVTTAYRPVMAGA